MSDINLFQIGGKAARRTVEGLEDTYCALIQGTASILWKDHNTAAKGQSDRILQEAIVAFEHNDTKEAKHQLLRELYFTSIFESEAGSINEKATRAGLACLKGGFGGVMAEAVIKDVQEYNIDVKESFLGKYDE